MVRMAVRDNDRIEIPDPRIQKLQSDVRAAIGQHPLSSAFDEQGATGTAVPRLIRVALAPIGPNPRNAGGRPAAEDRQFQLGLALPNNR